MKKTMLILSAVSFLTACSSSPSNTGSGNYSTDTKIYDQNVDFCTFSDGKTTAPDWVCGRPIEEYGITETGYSRAGIAEEARLNAMERLAARVFARVDTNATSETRTVGGRSINNFSSRTTMKVKESLQGVRVLLRLRDPSSGGVHVLVTADEAAYQEALENAGFIRARDYEEQLEGDNNESNDQVGNGSLY